MAERKELLELYKLLVVKDRSVDPKQLDDGLKDKTDLDLLKTIMEPLRKATSATSGRVDDDSLAFPAKVRQNMDLKMEDHLWSELEKFNDHLKQDYTCRRQMLLRRLDCTVESFKWKGASAKNQQDGKKHEPKKGAARPIDDQIHEIYDKVRASIKEEPQISMANLLAVRESDCDSLLNSVVSSNNVDCQISYGKRQQPNQQYERDRSVDLVNLKHVIIPHVPDRGGRPEEVRPPVRETFGHQRGGFRHDRNNRGRHK